MQRIIDALLRSDEPAIRWKIRTADALAVLHAAVRLGP